MQRIILYKKVKNIRSRLDVEKFVFSFLFQKKEKLLKSNMIKNNPVWLNLEFPKSEPNNEKKIKYIKTLHT